MAERNGRNVINPVLRFLKDATPKSVTGGGKSEDSIVGVRLEKQRKSLSNAIESIEIKEAVSRAGKSHLVVRMFEDSNAPSYTPADLFNEKVGCKIVAPSYDGYMVEAEVSSLNEIANKIRTSTSIKDKVDISRVESVKCFSSEDVLRGRDADSLWPGDEAEEPHFNIWLMPFNSSEARNLVANEIRELYGSEDISFGDEKYDIDFVKGYDSSGGIENTLSEYVDNGRASVSVKVKSKEAFGKIVSSGAVYRVERASPLKTNKVAPGAGEEPVPSDIDAEGLPTVVIVDGGHSAKSYKILETLKIPPLVPDHEADQKHGNQIASVVVHGHAWNNNLKLPELDCKFVAAQAITKVGVPSQPTLEQFVGYLDAVAKHSSEHSSVWNLSFNEEGPTPYADDVSLLGHKISNIARKYNILPIISIGNVSPSNADGKLCPPADCEAALTVSGRQAKDGVPDEPCNVSLRGPGPSGMQKPELSWFSELRVIGGVTETGTSYSAPLVSSLAAHTFQKLKNATPDLVKALLINRSEIERHDTSLGYGTPWNQEHLPWICSHDTVTLAWTSKLKAGFAHYWRDIPIPEDMLDENNKLSGEAIFTAILNPKKSEELGRHYFSTRLEVALQAETASGRIDNLIKKEPAKHLSNKEKEDLKWNPVRHQRSRLSTRIKPDTARVYARIYARDLYQYDMGSHHDLDEQEVAFVLTFKKEGAGDALFNSMVKDLGNDVEYSVEVDQNIEIDS
ncbi:MULTISPECIES: S8 family peptidase [unclassified Modicisalibacter]|uniref:S8 family peptidase n=1 Tax=unclassified Modicisalibacter TaxID=2679913 RepID=UPI001CCB3A53|nr:MULTISPECIES: S8 family peptidase [unclassified Modicisalibacter]MBZ9558035.1 S8 family peptidase [Modicisalibacter sp. R2A 31.J]MBZ9573297.1 S8 family peptidase [Modicisalibacter sp. MOD 31.J]